MKNTKKFLVNYSFYFSSNIEISAETEQKAIDKVKQMIEHDDLTVNDMELGDTEVWVD